MASKAVVKNVDMDKQMERHALELCADAMKRFDLEKDIASHIKKDFERKYGATWHCIVGRSYGSDENLLLVAPIQKPSENYSTYGAASSQQQSCVFVTCG
ncbi:hypothetical protein CRM22_005095 [Opisthorchis felineus]|uniref:Dynein light chain n=1 Tax=Opisthorchis felineus TaxID=147828 RepID=A0A4S2LSR9_OPIFE|nr:hypothetical protein CRM22_005095 [Opisthorchis felineus]